MRTKLLLTAAAALAAGLVSSNAQTVYSKNVVGYVTVVSPGNANSLICNPLDNGTNKLNGLVTAPTGSHVLVWNGTGFTGYTRLPTSWSGTPANPTIAPGEGFFLVPNGANPVTNVFVGQVIAAPGGSVTNAVPGNVNSLVGSMIPFSDTVNSTNINLKPATGSHLLIWNGSGYTGYTRLPTSWSGTPANPTITPGEGFFVVPNGSSAYNWVQSLPSN